MTVVMALLTFSKSIRLMGIFLEEVVDLDWRGIGIDEVIWKGYSCTHASAGRTCIVYCWSDS